MNSKNEVGIAYYSRNTGNTEDLLKGVARLCRIDLINLRQVPSPDLSRYRIVGLASGVYARGRLHRSLFRLVKKSMIPESAGTFILYTSGMDVLDSEGPLKALLRERGYDCLGCWHCPGHSYALRFRLLYGSGISAGHPNRQDIREGAYFLRTSIMPFLLRNSE